MIKNLIIFIIISLSSSYDIGLQTIKYTPAKNIDMNMGDWREGKRIFETYLKLQCGLSNDKFTITHTQDEWEDIAQAGKFKDEMFKICPKLKRIYRDEWSPHLYQFAYEFASDSGNVPYY